MSEQFFNFSEVAQYLEEGKDATEIFGQLDYSIAAKKISKGKLMFTCLVIWFDRQDILREILKRGWPLSGDDREGLWPLHTACAVGKIEVVSLLLKHVDRTQLHFDGQAFRYDRECLKDETFAFYGHPLCYETPLYYALAHDDIDLCKLMLPYYEYNLNTMVVKPLHYCCIQGAVKCAKYLLDSGHSAFDTVIPIGAIEWMSGRRPLEIAIHTSVPLTELLLEHEASNQDHQETLRSRNSNMLIHNVIASIDQFSLLKWKRGVMPAVIKLLIDHGVSVNGIYNQKTLVGLFFSHIRHCFKTFATTGSISNLKDFFNELVESAEIVTHEGLDATQKQIFDTFVSNFKFGPVICVFFRTNKTGEPSAQYVVESFSGGVDLLIALWPNKIRQDGDKTFDLLTHVLDVSTYLIQKFEQNSEENRPRVYQTLHALLVRIFLYFPYIEQDNLLCIKTFIGKHTLGDSNDTKSWQTSILLLLLNLISTRDIHRLDVPEECIAQRITLKNFSRLAVIRHLSVPKTKNILQLHVPETLTSYLCFECN